MKRGAQPTLSVEGQQTLGQFADALRQVEDLSAVTVRNYITVLRQFIASCECSWREEWNEAPSPPQAVTPPLLIGYRTYLQATLLLKPSSVNRAIMSLKRYFAWATQT
jgi:integrase/recombinase XerD